MKFEVTVYDIDGKEKEKHQIEAKELNTVKQNLQEDYYCGKISSYEIKPVTGGET